MKLTNFDYETWTINHQESHPAAWFRQYYPFNLLAEIDFNFDLVDAEQPLQRGKLRYSALLKSIDLQDNGRYKSVLAFRDQFDSKTKRWKNRVWQTDFVVIYTPSGAFITVYTDKKDPTKEAVRRFFSGDFERLSVLKSIPLSNILIQSIILNISEKYFPNGRQDVTYKWLPEGILPALDHPGTARKKSNFFVPIYSIERDLWVCYAFTEEKAHRVAIYNGDQCRKLYVIFVNPTPTPHHRCRYKHASVLSLNEYTNFRPKKSVHWLDQIRFLQNHMNPLETGRSIVDIEREIHSPKQQSYIIQKSHLMEAMTLLNLLPTNENEMFFYLCAMNLINAWINAQRKQKQRTQDKKLKSLYAFKNRLADVLEYQLKTDSLLAKVYIDGSLVMLEIHGYQFSFHAVKIGGLLSIYRDSQRNEHIEWCGKRMQPIASLVYELGKLKCPRGLTKRVTQIL